jgi:hypothetical protein
LNGFRREHCHEGYKGFLKGNTVILEEKPDLPDECPVLVEIKPLDKTRDEEIARRHLELLRKAPRVGKLLYKKREELYER